MAQFKRQIDASDPSYKFFREDLNETCDKCGNDVLSEEGQGFTKNLNGDTVCKKCGEVQKMATLH